MMIPGSGLDPVIGLAAAVLIVHRRWHVEETHSRKKARDEPTAGRAVNAHILEVM